MKVTDKDTDKERERSCSGNGRNRIDLHMHSTVSDGENTVQEIIKLAYDAGMRMIALSDHNQFAITERIEAGGESIGESGIMEVIPACEFSTTYDVPGGRGKREVHVIGLFPDGVNPADFDGVFGGIRQGKLDYAGAIIEKLGEAGIKIGIDEVIEAGRRSGKKYTGRHQVAEVLIDKGYAKSMEDAFDRYVGNTAPLHVPATNYVNYAEISHVVKLIGECGGIPVLCHPFGYFLEEYEIEELVRYFADNCAMGGIEVFYDKYLDDPEKIGFLKKMQKKYGLLASAGSDRHRKDRPFSYCRCNAPEVRGIYFLLKRKSHLS